MRSARATSPSGESRPPRARLPWPPDDPLARTTSVVAGCAAILLLAIGLVVAVHWQPLQRFDSWVSLGLHKDVAGTGWLHVFKAVSAVGQPSVAVAVLLAIGVVLALRRLWLRLCWVIVSLLVTWLACQGIKDWMQRPRPTLVHQLGGWSFPSGHASQAACTATVVVLLAVGVRARLLRGVLVALAVIAALLVGVSRLFLAAHYPSDVVAGWLLGVLVVCAGGVALGRPGSDRLGLATRRLATLPAASRAFAVIVNPIKLDSDGFRARVSRTARATGWDEPLWFETTVDDAGGSMARSAVAAGAELVIAAGGDGTVRVVCAEMAGRGVPVGIVPAGTGNLLARNLGLPLGRDQALDVALNGRDRAVDLVRVSGDGIDPTRFAVMAGMGLDAAIMDGAPDRMKRRMGWPAYVVAALRHLRYPAVRVDISIDGAEPVRRRARTVVVGNVGTLTGGINLLPDARIDDGLLDVVVIAPRQILGWLTLLWRVVRRQRRTDEQLDRFTGRSALVTAASSTPRQLDGDTIGWGTELRAEIEPGVLLVRVP